ncbi:MAG TPA: sigma-70 family RNA polymerase sigma factor [Vicinamibacterales bacterium]|nr:sigma-70 family RNA polymerase sigma factor [Vicinamibacterales bacterium]
MTAPSSYSDGAPSRAADELLVIRCQLGEPEAFEALIESWNGPLWLYVRRMTGRDDDAQDVLQDVWLRVIRGIARLRDGSRLRGWLFGIARNVLMDRMRRQYAAPASTDVDVSGLAAETDIDVLDREADLAAMESALETLPLVEREVLTLFYLRDLSLAELADALVVPIGTVKSRLFRARKLLRTAVERKD